MNITIEIPNQPEGYSTPEWRPVYNPFEGQLILIGETWVPAEDELKMGGRWEICCRKDVGK